MPFDFRRNIQYQPINPAMIAGAAKSPFSIAGQENAIDNRAFGRDIQGVKSLEALASMRVPQTKEAQAMMAQKTGILGAIGAEKQQQRLFEIAEGKAEREKTLFDITQQERAEAPQILGGIAQGVETPEGTRPFNLQELKKAQLIYPENKTVFDALQKQIEPLEKATKTVAPTRANIVQDVADYASRIATGEVLDKADAADFSVKKQYIESEGDVDREIIDKNSAIVKKHHGNLLNLKNEITNDDIQRVKAYEKKIGYKPNATADKAIKEKYTVLEAHKRVDKLVQSIDNEELARGIVDQPKNWFTGMFSDDAFGGLSKEAKQKRLLSVLTNRRIGNFLAKYIKSISGTAVAEKEYDRLATVLKGGSDLTNIQTLKQSFSTFGVDLANEFNDELKTNLLDNTGTVLDLSKRYKKDTMEYYQEASERIFEASGKSEEKVKTITAPDGTVIIIKG